MNQLINITEQQLQDYMSCPIYYNLRYNNQHVIDKAITMNSLLNQIVSGFCLKLMDQQLMSLYDIKRKWDMLCNKHPDIIDSRKCIEGMVMLTKFYNWAAENQILIGDVGRTYAVLFKVGNDVTELKGTIGIITVTKNKQLEELIVSFSNKLPDQSQLDMNLKTTITNVAAYHIYNSSLLGTKILHAKTGKVFYTTRDPNSEWRRLGIIATNVAKSIKAGVWYPHESPLCISCRVKDFCRMWGIEI